MLNKTNWLSKNLHLLISIMIVLPTGIIYGTPSILEQLLEIQTNTIDLSNMLKAIMFLYIGISFVWFLGLWKAKYWKRATELNILFMIALAIGRALSMTVDGTPTRGYIWGFIAEILIGIYSIYQLKKFG